MGYRSDVAIKIYGNKEKILELKYIVEAELSKASDEFIEIVNDLINSSCETVDRDLWEFDDDDASFLFFAEWVKWYDGIPEVDYFNYIYETAKKMGESDETLIGEYVRIGEELDDNVHEGFNDDYQQLTIRRSIEY
jgi:hypothetical protein